jgi:hypothetical protein
MNATSARPFFGRNPPTARRLRRTGSLPRAIRRGAGSASILITSAYVTFESARALGEATSISLATLFWPLGLLAVASFSFFSRTFWIFSSSPDRAPTAAGQELCVADQRPRSSRSASVVDTSDLRLIVLDDRARPCIRNFCRVEGVLFVQRAIPPAAPSLSSLPAPRHLLAGAVSSRSLVLLG